jgi:hypothetical protein
MFNSPGVPPANPNALSGPDRRKWTRYPASQAMSSYLATGTQVVFPERIDNISAGGVRLTLRQQLTPGTLATLDLYNLHRDFPFQITLRVVYVLQQPDGSLQLGCAFGRELHNSEVWGLL